MIPPDVNASTAGYARTMSTNGTFALVPFSIARRNTGVSAIVARTYSGLHCY